MAAIQMYGLVRLSGMRSNHQATKGWKGTKQNIDRLNHGDKDKTYDWNGSVQVEAYNN